MIEEPRDQKSMPALRNRCKNLSEIWGKTVFPAHHSDGYCRLSLQHGPAARTPLTGAMKVECVRAIVEWEIAKAEGTLRNVA